MIFKRTYSIEVAAESAMEWNKYEKTLLEQWLSLLDAESANERSIHSFLEQHPALVPGAFTVCGSGTGHYPWRAALFSQAVLPSYGHRVPDFMWITVNSDTESPLLIEIEAPQKRWFTDAGNPTSHLTQALNQIAEWKAWFADPVNTQAFKAFYRLDEVAWMRRRFRPAYVLIYGRRFEANARPALTAKRSHLIPEDVIAMTYDRLLPDCNASQMISVRARVQGTLEAVSVPPTLQWSPGLAEDRAHITGLEEAIRRNKLLTDARREFLLSRLPYWNHWAKHSERGIITSGDAE